MPIARPLPQKTTIVFDTGELVRLAVVLEQLKLRGDRHTELALLERKVNVALSALDDAEECDVG